ncbi:MAG: flagellar hook-basal body complex protein FliE [Lachnospiraceae bacterium]
MEGISFITQIKPWEAISGFEQGVAPGQSGTATMFQDVFKNVVNQVYETGRDVEQKQYLLAAGQLDDAHSLPIAEAKAALSLDVMISLRNKAMESYNELLKMNI